jgi:membrane protein
LIGTYLVTHELQGTSASYGVFGIVLGLLAWIYLSTLRRTTVSGE